ncbi:hypothetical protein [Mesorhizobium sp.]|uniref:hypothetical protein n=1 Tax=Mesorhizobium sp. TaxID=1871066 RepID=UPI000FEA54B5|nr:hypothetical protein [Mesorhizobium sp.]RWO22166.1 MAG: hypothetical protein EOS09_21245 [Mesorhizobium sp.]
MYPIRIGFDQALERIESLLRNGHDAEALVTSMFTLEKLIKRSLRKAIVARGFTREQADTILGRDGFDSLKEKWPVFERQHRTLQEILDQNWQQIPEAKKMRNNLVHGIKVYDLEDCRTKASAVLAALRTLHAYVMQDYGSDPWNTQPRPKAQLQWVL